MRSSLAQGKWVILEIDVDGAGEVLRQFPEAVTIFIRPDSVEELERRLRARGTESEDAIQRRLAVARRELQLADQYEYQVVNDTVAAGGRRDLRNPPGHGFEIAAASVLTPTLTRLQND